MGPSDETIHQLKHALMAAAVNHGPALLEAEGISHQHFLDNGGITRFSVLFNVLSELGPGPVSLPALDAELARRFREANRRSMMNIAAGLAASDEVLPLQVPQLARALKQQLRNIEVSAAASALLGQPESSAAQERLLRLLEEPSMGNHAPRSLFAPAVAFLGSDTTAVEYLVAGLIEKDTTGQLFGPSGGGKTFVALDLALSVAAGGHFNDRPAKQGIVLYLAGEGHGGLRRRVKAWHIYHGADVDALNLLQISMQTVCFDGAGLSSVKAEAKHLSEVLESLSRLSSWIPWPGTSTATRTARATWGPSSGRSMTFALPSLAVLR